MNHMLLQRGEKESNKDPTRSGGLQVLVNTDIV